MFGSLFGQRARVMLSRDEGTWVKKMDEKISLKTKQIKSLLN